MAYNLTQADGTVVQALLDKVENLKTFSIADAGAIEGGTVDCTSALMDIVNSEGQNTCITIPQGDWLFEGPSTFNHYGIYIKGAAARATRILFEPSQAQTCFEWNTTQLLNQLTGGCFDMSFWSGDSQHAKTAIRFNDGSNFNIRDVTIGGTHPTNAPFHWSDISGSSIGIDGFGREVIGIDDIRIFADNPVMFGPTFLHDNLDCDQFNLHNTYLVAPIGSENSLITIRNNTEIKNTTIRGHNAWARGRCGFYWDTTVNDSVSFHVTLSGIRCEQGEQAGGETYSIYIDHNVHNVSWLVLEQIRCDLGRKHGIYLRGVDNVRMSDVCGSNGHPNYVPVQGAPLHIEHNSNNSCKSISWENCNFGHYGGTSILPKDLMLVKGTDNPRVECELPLHAQYVKRQISTHAEAGKLVTEDSRLIRFAKTLVSPQTGQATINAAAKTITAISGLDFTGMDYDTLIYLNTVNNPHRFYTLTFDTSATVLHIDSDTIVNDTNVTVTIVHGMGLYHRGNIAHMSKTSISLYAENENTSNRLMHLEFLNGKATGTKNVTIHETHPTDFFVDPFPAGDKTPPADAFSVFGETQPIRVWNNRTTNPSNAKFIIEQINF